MNFSTLTLICNLLKFLAPSLACSMFSSPCTSLFRLDRVAHYLSENTSCLLITPKHTSTFPQRSKLRQGQKMSVVHACKRCTCNSNTLYWGLSERHQLPGPHFITKFIEGQHMLSQLTPKNAARHRIVVQCAGLHYVQLQIFFFFFFLRQTSTSFV